MDRLDAAHLRVYVQAEDGIRDTSVTGVQTCALPICCSTTTTVLGDQRVIEGQSVMPRDSDPRSERRSTDGQTILKVARSNQEQPADLVICGAPLRNRTVDLLLTIGTAARPEGSACTDGPAGRADGPERAERSGQPSHDPRPGRRPAPPCSVPARPCAAPGRLA